MKLNKKFGILAIFVSIIAVIVCLTGCDTKLTGTVDYNYYAWDNEKQQIIVSDSSLDLTSRDAKGYSGVVCAANPYAALSGIEVLMKGGNAFDAAVAVSYALGVVEPYASGVGGGGIMVAYDVTAGEYVCYNFREFNPGAYTASYVNAKGGAEWLDIGIGSVAVPTFVAGMNKIIEDRGSGVVDRQAIMAPAIRYAEEGFIITETLANTIADMMPTILTCESETKSVFCSRGTKAKKAGEILIQEDYAHVLKLIAELGNDGFYKGEVAEAILAAMETYGGGMTQEDLDRAAELYPILEDPISTTYKGYEIYSSNNPSSGGIILAEALNCLEYYQNSTGNTLQSLGHNSAEYINVLSTAMQLAYGDKQKYIGDTSINPATNSPFVDVPVQGLISKNYAAKRWNDNYNVGQAYYGKAASASSTNYGDYVWDYNGTTTPVAYDTDEYTEHYSTTSFSVADASGNIVSVTQTINHFFASGIVPTGCGFFLNNQQSSFNTTSTSSASYIYPYKQPVSHIMPTIIMKDGQPWATLGSPGSMRIPSAVVQTIVNMIDFDMNIQEAINAKRIFCYASGGTDDESTSTQKWIRIEAPTNELVSELEAMGYLVVDRELYDADIHLYFGGVQGIQFKVDEEGNSYMYGGADPRRDGKSFGY